MALLLTVAASPAAAAVSGDLQYSDTGTTITIDRCVAETCPASITIPATIAGKPVTTIGTNAFLGAGLLRTVTFEGTSSLTTIGAQAFRQTGLTAITIPASVTTIGDEAFWLAGLLTTVTFGGTSSLTTIGDGAFRQTGLTSIAIPASVTSIGELAFFSTPALKTATFAADARLTTIGHSAFRQSGLTSVTLPDSVTTLDNAVFSETTALETVSIGRGLTSIPQLAFYESALRSIRFREPSVVTSIQNQAFYGVPNLATITIPSSVTSVGADTFRNATGLTSVVFAWPSTVPSFGSLTFNGTSNLTTIDFFGAAPTVSAGAFDGTSAALTVRYLAATGGWAATLGRIPTALAPPWTPATPTATPGAGSAAVTTSVAYPSNAPSEIRVTASPGGRTCSIVGSAGTCTVTGLTDGTAYTFTATAASAAGTSGASDPSSPVTPATPAQDTAVELRVSKPRTTRRAIVSTVTMSGPGVIRQIATRRPRAAGAPLCTAVRRTAKAGSLTITCAFTPRVRAELRRRSIRAVVTTTFTPIGGAKTTSTRTIVIPRSR